MRFKYVCSDCGREYVTDSIMYQCPECSKENDGKTFPKGNLIVKLDKEVLEKARKKDHVTTSIPTLPKTKPNTLSESLLLWHHVGYRRRQG